MRARGIKKIQLFTLPSPSEASWRGHFYFTKISGLAHQQAKIKVGCRENAEQRNLYFKAHRAAVLSVEVAEDWRDRVNSEKAGPSHTPCLTPSRQLEV